ncbi:LuxR C-terminal-related transcriptional regulator [Flavobacterium sp. TSSA_36]|uniref:helix-turn-helix and ligand-binding sensor domain-containing protein n=1 Tax=Flavobacterium sp. TSSA_36 TaxID=3447669 RepID=UPI003F2DE998
MKKISTLFLLLVVFCGSAQELLPFVENYDKSNFKGDNQVWDVTQGQDKAMYFANNHFLLRYNGVIWEKYQLPNKTVIRSVFADQDRIYCGSYKEFGYWKRSHGKMTYYSISKRQQAFDEQDNEEIWKIFKAKERIYFQSFNNLFWTEKGQLQKITFPFLISYCYVIEDQIYVATVGHGIFKLKGKQLQKIPGWEALENNVIHGLQKKDNQWFVFTHKNGVFVTQNNKLVPWNAPLNAVLKAANINKAKLVSNDKMLVGSMTQGVFLYDFKSETYQNMNRKNTLLNNTVLSSTLDQENNLWLGLDNGISHVEINSPIAILNDNSGTLGSVYAAVQTLPSKYLLASNHGVFEFEENKLKLLQGTKGQAWQISASPSGFVIGHNDGTFLYNPEGQLSKINPINGGWNFIKSNLNESYWQATYTGITVYPNPLDLKVNKTIQGLLKPIKYVAQIRKNEIWAADNYRGLYRVTLDEKWNTQKVENITQNSGLKNDFGVKLFEFRKELIFWINSNWYSFNAMTNTLEKNTWFQKNFKDISDIISIDDQQFLVEKNGQLYHIKEENNHFKWNTIPEKYYKGKLINDHLKISKTPHNYLLNLEDGFITLKLDFKNTIVEKTSIEAFSLNKKVENGGEIDFNSELKVMVISGKYGIDKPNLFYKMDQSNHYHPIKRGIIQVNNWNSGSHTLSIFQYDGRNFTPTQSFHVVVKQPWYFSLGMILLYVAMLSTLFWGYYKWNKGRYIQRLKLQEEALKHQNELKELELKAQSNVQIQAYEKHILELELQSKSSEVAGKSLSIAKQTEMMDSIQSILESDADMNKLKSDIRKIIKINSVNKHEWESFESNLNQIHKEFITQLNHNFPQLTPKDIKLCIYLKMNLSSKEIAPMMNISFRGVELHRYRLRKKLGLKQEENLTKFLLNLEALQ